MCHLIMVGLFKLTGLMFHIASHLIGAVLSIFGWMIPAGLAVRLFGLAMYALPVILDIGVVSLIAES